MNAILRMLQRDGHTGRFRNNPGYSRVHISLRTGIGDSVDQLGHQEQKTRTERLAGPANMEMRNRLQSMYRIEEHANASFNDLLKRLDDASAGKQVGR